MSTPRKETGIELLRRVVRAAGHTREDAISDYTPDQLVNLFRACWASDWDIFPDELTREERDHAACRGVLSVDTTERLRERYG